MTPELLIVVVIVAGAVVSLVTEWLRTDRVGALLGWLICMFVTLSNLLADTALKDVGLKAVGAFDLLPVGGAAAMAVILHIACVGRRPLPLRNLQKETFTLRGTNTRESLPLVVPLVVVVVLPWFWPLRTR